MCVCVRACVCVCVCVCTEYKNYGTYLVYHCAGANILVVTPAFNHFLCVGNTNRATSSTDKVDEGCDGVFVICYVPT